MNAHLAEISRHVTPAAHALLVLDGAGLHSMRSLVFPENITLMQLPPCSLELIRSRISDNTSDRTTSRTGLFDSYEGIVDVPALRGAP